MLPVTSFEITYQLNQNDPVTKQITDATLESMEVYNYLIEAPINEEGKGNLKLTVSNPISLKILLQPSIPSDA